MVPLCPRACVRAVLCCAVTHGSLSLSLALTLVCCLFVNHRSEEESTHITLLTYRMVPRCDGCDGDVCVVCEIDFWRCGLRTYSRQVGGGHSRQLMWESCSKSKILHIYFFPLPRPFSILERLKVSSSSVVRRPSSVPIKFPRKYISNDYTY